MITDKGHNQGDHLRFGSQDLENNSLFFQLEKTAFKRITSKICNVISLIVHDALRSEAQISKLWFYVTSTVKKFISQSIVHPIYCNELGLNPQPFRREPTTQIPKLLTI